ncbi:hypothetical protein L2E82_24685 [Cichorium intybus]|uniref:Uncharacterized protein n=1 Tax=Cichorium intybus TaxID=13427 RepID=A0ACB9E1U0_CICIN|nr:hypothetical protein L2E82_24685 [Cichorium intybus]
MCCSRQQPCCSDLAISPAAQLLPVALLCCSRQQPCCSVPDSSPAAQPLPATPLPNSPQQLRRQPLASGHTATSTHNDTITINNMLLKSSGRNSLRYTWWLVILSSSPTACYLDNRLVARYLVSSPATHYLDCDPDMYIRNDNLSLFALGDLMILGPSADSNSMTARLDGRQTTLLDNTAWLPALLGRTAWQPASQPCLTALLAGPELGWPNA